MGLVSEDKGEKGRNLVASRSVPGLGPLGPCHASAVLGEWLGHPRPEQKLAPVTSDSVPGKLLMSLLCFWIASLKLQFPLV